VGEVVAQVVKVRPGPVSTYGLRGGGRIRERLVGDGDPQPVQNPAVAGILVEPRSVAVITQRREFAEQGVEFQQHVTVRADVPHSGVAATRSELTCWLRSAPSEHLRFSDDDITQIMAEGARQPVTRTRRARR
jgi:hypothetical protein